MSGIATHDISFTDQASGKIAARTQADAVLAKNLRHALHLLRDNPLRFSEPLYRHKGMRRAKVNYRHRLIFSLDRGRIVVRDFDTRENIERWY